MENNTKQDVVIELCKAGKVNNAMMSYFRPLHVQYLKKILEARIIMRDYGAGSLNNF